MVQGLPREKVHEILSQPIKAGCGGVRLSPQLCGTVNRRTVVQVSQCLHKARLPQNNQKQKGLAGEAELKQQSYCLGDMGY
jgi:hypothetical protein